MNAIALEPAFPIVAILALAAAALVALVLTAWRSPASAPFRLVAFIALLGLLLNPQFRVAEETPLDDIAVIIVDESGSNRLAERADMTARAADALEEKLSALGDIEIIRTGIGGEEETRLGEAIETAATNNPRARLGAIFVISDGQATDAASFQKLNPDAPVHLLRTGGADDIDRKVTMIKAPRYGIVNEGVDISFRIDDVGTDEKRLEGRGQAVVALRVDGEEALREPVPVGAEITFTAPLPHPGRTVIELEVEPVDGELTDKNNVAVLPISAIRDRLRVLLISGEPHPGERVWRNLLKSDPAIDLVHFTILRPIEKAQADNALERELALIEFPQDELFVEKLSEFDLVIFDRYTYRGVLNSYHFDNLARYVEAGGAVLVSSGPEFNGYLSLAARRNFAFILPAMPSGEEVVGPFRPQISETGRRHPVTADLPETDFWGRWLRIMPASKRSGATLMTDETGAPLLIVDRVGEGRVGLLQSDHFWLWARGFDGGGPHAELLRRIAHWLMKEPELEEERLLLSDQNGALIIERRTINESASPASVETPSGETVELPLDPDGAGRFAARIADAPRGLYRARSDGLFAIAAVGLAAPPEFENVVATGEKLAPAREAAGGGVFALGAGAAPRVPEIRRVNARSRDRAGADWAGLVEREAYRTESVAERPLVGPWAWLVALAAALVGAWLIEGRGWRFTRPPNAP